MADEQSILKEEEGKGGENSMKNKVTITAKVRNMCRRMDMKRISSAPK